jgi:hypothetical protein
LHDGAADLLDIDTGPIISDGDLKHSRRMAGFHADKAIGGLADSVALGRSFATMIHGVAQQVGKRSFQPIEDVPVHLRALSDDFEPHALAESARQIPHHPRKAAGAVGEGAHPCAKHFQIKPVRQMRRAAIEPIQLFQALGEELLALV